MVRIVAFLGAFAITLAVLAGCNNSDAPMQTAEDPAKTAEPKNGEHDHNQGEHGGSIVPVGEDNYHAEGVFDKNGAFKLYIRGRDEAAIQEVIRQTLDAELEVEGTDQTATIELKSAPQRGDGEGKTSRFLGQFPPDMVGKAVVVRIPSITFPDGRFRIPPIHSRKVEGHDEEMPSKVAANEEEELYLKPGGLYTEADIKANGQVTASQKFKGIKAPHNAKPQPGDLICPISETKATAKFTWVVGGKAYEFCCPPCVDDFVKNAKEHPEKIKEPSEYIKK